MKEYLVFENVNKIVNGNYILKNINLKVYKGEIIGIVGLNGSGKTTLLKCVLNFVNFDGKIYVDNKQNNFLVKTGFLIENPNLYLNLTGKENISFWLSFFDNVDMNYVSELCLLFSLNLNKKVRRYSLGMKQKLGLILSLINKPELLLLDEPTNGLDIKNIINLRNILVNLNETTILISSHDINELSKICDRLVLINNGKIVKIIEKRDFLIYREKKLVDILENYYV